eukprot:gene16286-22183_t
MAKKKALLQNSNNNNNNNNHKHDESDLEEYKNEKFKLQQLSIYEGLVLHYTSHKYRRVEEKFLSKHLFELDKKL